MRSICSILCLGLLLLSANLHAQTSPEESYILGKCQRTLLMESPYQKWYQANYDNYQPNEEILAALKELPINEYRIQIFFGSWCGDSKRELPRFLKIMDQLGFPQDQIELIGVDKGEQYKQSPAGEQKRKSIFRVPVFIMLKENQEVARIVEYPVTSLERDLLAILQGQTYRPNYFSYPYLIQWEQDGVLKDQNVDAISLRNQVQGKVHSSSELNTAGYVFLKAGKFEEAIKIFTLNVYLFPEEANTYDSLGEAFEAGGKHSAAIWAYGKVLEKDAENQHAKDKIAELKALSESSKAFKK